MSHGVDRSAGQREHGEYRQGEEKHGLIPENAGELGIDDEEAFRLVSNHTPKISQFHPE